MTQTAERDTSRRSLWQIEAELEQIEALLDDMEATADDKAAAVDAWLEGSGELRGKVDGYCSLIRLRESMAKMRQEEASRLSELAQSDSKVAIQLKGRLHEFMKRHEIEKMDTDRFRLARQKNGGVTPLHLECEPESLPAQYTRTVVQFDADTIRRALEGGAAIEGVRLGERGEHLRIR